jgi:TRAP-type mannitol/chloroaromatic compound transport system substrate-binding protein
MLTRFALENPITFPGFARIRYSPAHRGAQHVPTLSLDDSNDQVDVEFELCPMGDPLMKTAEMHQDASQNTAADAATPAISKRRSFLAGAAAATAGAATVGFPMIAKAQAPINLRFQSTWPAKDIFHEYAVDFATRVNAMAGGRLKIEVLPSGSVVKAFDLLDAVSKGTLDGGHGVVAYWYGKQNALALWGSGPAFGMDPNMVLAWHNYGGGKALLDEIYRGLNMDVQSFLYGPMPTQPLGWFKKPIAKVDDLKGLKFRTVGLSIDVFTDMGLAVNALPGAEIVPALDRGLLDAAEFNNASSDRLLGFPDVAKVCMLQSFHQASEQFEILFNKKKYDALPAELKAVIQYAVEASSADMSWKAIDRYSKDYGELEKAGVKFFKTPDPVLQAQLNSWDKVVAGKSADNPTFKKVNDSMRAFAQRAGRWQNDTLVNYRMAYNHFFSRR